MKPEEIKTETSGDTADKIRGVIDDLLRILWVIVLVGWICNGGNI